MHERIGRTRIKLARMISEQFEVNCKPEDLHPAGGRARNRTSSFDMYAWEAFASTKTGHPWVAGSFSTMGECVKVGKLKIIRGEICPDYGDIK